MIGVIYWQSQTMVLCAAKTLCAEMEQKGLHLTLLVQSRSLVRGYEYPHPPIPWPVVAYLDYGWSLSSMEHQRLSASLLSMGLHISIVSVLPVQVHVADVDRRVPSRSTSSLETQSTFVMFPVVFSCFCTVPAVPVLAPCCISQVETRMKVDMNTTFGKIISQEELEEPRNSETSTVFKFHWMKFRENLFALLC